VHNLDPPTTLLDDQTVTTATLFEFLQASLDLFCVKEKTNTLFS